MLRKKEQQEMQKVLKTGKWSGYDNSDVAIVAEHTIGENTVYTFYSYNKGGSYSREASEITVTGDMKRKDTEIYPWDTFKPEERLDINYLNELESFEDIDMSKEELVLLLMQYHTALNRGEEIIKRSIGLEDTSSDEEVVPQKKSSKKESKPGKTKLGIGKLDVQEEIYSLGTEEAYGWRTVAQGNSEL